MVMNYNGEIVDTEKLSNEEALALVYDMIFHFNDHEYEWKKNDEVK